MHDSLEQFVSISFVDSEYPLYIIMELRTEIKYLIKIHTSSWNVYINVSLCVFLMYYVQNSQHQTREEWDLYSAGTFLIKIYHKYAVPLKL